MEVKTIEITGAKAGGLVVVIKSGFNVVQTMTFEHRNETDEQYASRITQAINEEVYAVVVDRMQQIRTKEQEAKNT